MKPLARLGAEERAVVEIRRRDRGRKALTHFTGDRETTLRTLLERLLPGVPDHIDLAAFVDSTIDQPLGRGDRRDGVPATPQLFVDGITAFTDQSFLDMTEEEQRDLITRMRRGELETLGKELIDRLLDRALTGYLSHPDTWERIGFNGPAYPEGYAWIGAAEAGARHRKESGWDRL